MFVLHWERICPPNPFPTWCTCANTSVFHKARVIEWHQQAEELSWVSAILICFHVFHHVSKLLTSKFWNDFAALVGRAYWYMDKSVCLWFCCEICLQASFSIPRIPKLWTRAAHVGEPFCFWQNVFEFSPNSFSYRGSYFKLGGEGSQILWIRCGGCHTGCRWRCRLVSVCSVGVRVPRPGCQTGCRWRCRLVCVGARVRRSKTGLSHRVTGCRWRCDLLMCVRVWVRRSKTGLSSHRVPLKLSSDACRGQGEGAVTDDVIGGVIWCVYGWGFAVLFLCKCLFLLGYFLYLYFGLFLAQKYIYGRRCILWIGLKQIAENRWYLSMLGVYAVFCGFDVDFWFAKWMFALFALFACAERCVHMLPKLFARTLQALAFRTQDTTTWLGCPDMIRQNDFDFIWFQWQWTKWTTPRQCY